MYINKKQGMIKMIWNFSGFTKVLKIYVGLDEVTIDI